MAWIGCDAWLAISGQLELTVTVTVRSLTSDKSVRFRARKCSRERDKRGLEMCPCDAMINRIYYLSGFIVYIGTRAI